MKTIADGLLIVFDGVDGVGKSTQIQLVKAWLQADDWQVNTTRNLGGTPIGEALRKVMVAAMPRPPKTDLYISAAIQEALIDEVAHLRQSGAIILMDRGPLSQAAYQVYGSGVDADLGWDSVERGMQGLRPDLTILYTGDVGTALDRARQQSATADYFESKSIDYFERVAQGFTEAARRYELETISADQTVEAVSQQTTALVKQLLNDHLRVAV